MSENVTAPKIAASNKAIKKPVVRKAPAKTAPATKAPTRKVPAPKQAAPKTTPTVEANEKSPKKVKKNSKKVKVIRDSFTMPESDYSKIADLKQLCLKGGIQVKKSELLRAGLHALGKLTAAQLKTTMNSLEKIKTGRPEKK